MAEYLPLLSIPSCSTILSSFYQKCLENYYSAGCLSRLEDSYSENLLLLERMHTSKEARWPYFSG